MGWKGGASSGQITKHRSLNDKWAKACRSKPAQKKKMFAKKRAKVAEVCEEESNFEEPEGGTDEEATEMSEASKSSDQGEADQGNA